MVNDLGKFMKILRINCGDSAKEMASKLDISPSYLSAIESGIREMPESIVSKIKEIYNLSEAQQKEFNDLVSSSQISNEASVKLSTKGLSKDMLSTIKGLYQKKDMEARKLSFIQSITDMSNDEFDQLMTKFAKNADED